MILLEGPNLVAGALDAGLRLETVFAKKDGELTRRAAEAGAEVLTVAESVMKRLSDTENPRGPIAVAQAPDDPTIALADTVVLAGIRDPGNAGTLIRSAAAFGFQVVATEETVDLWSPKVLRSAAGAHFQTPIVSGATAEAVAAAGVRLVALVPRDDGSPEPDPAAGPIGLLVGNEAKGLGPAVLELAVATLTIPTERVESLNAAVAGSIAMFAIAQGR